MDRAGNSKGNRESKPIKWLVSPPSGRFDSDPAPTNRSPISRSDALRSAYVQPANAGEGRERDIFRILVRRARPDSSWKDAVASSLKD